MHAHDKAGNRLPGNFRKLTMQERRTALKKQGYISETEIAGILGEQDRQQIADIMVENAVGIAPIPLGIADGFVIDGRPYVIPMATEEPSVVAAASYAARIIATGGGLSTWATDPIMTAQVYIEGVGAEAKNLVISQKSGLTKKAEDLLLSLKRRGGGFRGLTATYLDELGILRIHLHVDVRDAMGANALNTLAESFGRELVQITGGRVLMAILTNETPERRAGAKFSIPITALSRGAASHLQAEEVAERFVLAGKVAEEDSPRAVTHNKGIMNGISALALATGNDTRGIEAAVHSWAGRSGAYRSLTSYSIKDQFLSGSIELPLPMATVGGAVGFLPSSIFSLKLLGNPNAVTLARIAAALGLTQNCAALLALVTSGIQRGHMGLHAKRLAYGAGARGKEISAVCALLQKSGVYNAAEAASALKTLRRGEER